jgi:hypothetical protein
VYPALSPTDLDPELLLKKRKDYVYLFVSASVLFILDVFGCHLSVSTCFDVFARNFPSAMSCILIGPLKVGSVVIGLFSMGSAIRLIDLYWGERRAMWTIIIVIALHIVGYASIILLGFWQDLATFHSG